ncbi:histone deacetylase [Candidatus Bathyarchaeota archaeon]|nr:histone deacetylase [Candidatus Bathyarchaeota archaeon]
MTETAVVYSPKYLNHKTGPSHPEVPSRLRVIMRELNKSGILENENCSLIEPENASIKDLQLVHDTDYIHRIKQFCACGGGLLDVRDTMVSPESYDVARLAAGGTVKAADLVMTGKYRNAFAFVRPPGHHAGPEYPMGFCVFNNVAVAAAHLLKNFSLNRVLILDIDTHHGNGTQEIFYRSNKVLYVSLHEDPTEFPLTGFAEEVGEDEGSGYTVNIPLPYGTDNRIYLKAFNEIAVPIINQYKPQFILVSTGFDAHYTDPVGDLSLSALSYVRVFDAILESASKFCQGKLVTALEGGYNLRFLGKLASAVTARLAEIPYSIRDKHRGAGIKIRKKGEKTIEQVKKIQSSFWNIKS